MVSGDGQRWIPKLVAGVALNLGMSTSTSVRPASKRGKDTTTVQENEVKEDASLLHRLAGPSSMKAGLAIDQQAMNKKIAEASEGSKYYEVAFSRRKTRSC